MTGAVWVLSGLADEFSPDPATQVRVLASLGARHLEVRSAWDVDVLDFDGPHCDALNEVLAREGFAVSAIAPRLGDEPVGIAREVVLERTARAVAIAKRLGTARVRVGGFTPPAGVPADAVLEEAVGHLRAMRDLAHADGIELLLENVPGTIADVPRRLRAMLDAVDELGLMWAPANLVRAGIRPFTDGWAQLSDRVRYVRIRDARHSDGAVQLPGDGDAQLPELVHALRLADYDGVVSVRPDLTVAGEQPGVPGESSFERAVMLVRVLVQSERVSLR